MNCTPNLGKLQAPSQLPQACAPMEINQQQCHATLNPDEFQNNQVTYILMQINQVQHIPFLGKMYYLGARAV